MDMINEILELEALSRVIASIVFVVIAGVISRWQSADLERDLAIATVRSFVQLIAIGFALELIFKQDHPFWTTLVLFIMTFVAARTAADRAKDTPHAFMIALLAIGVGSALTVLFLWTLAIFRYIPQEIIPIGGMIIGNSMTTATLVITRLTKDFYNQRLVIETRLALGATGREASLSQFRQNLKSAMIPMIDTTKTVGLIKLPGAMTGMILVGASPLEAVQIQLIVMYMLVGSVTFTGLIAAYLTYRQFFTADHQMQHITLSK